MTGANRAAILRRMARHHYDFRGTRRSWPQLSRDVGVYRWRGRTHSPPNQPSSSGEREGSHPFRMSRCVFLSYISYFLFLARIPSILTVIHAPDIFPATSWPVFEQTPLRFYVPTMSSGSTTSSHSSRISITVSPWLTIPHSTSSSCRGRLYGHLRCCSWDD
jgi:hypothetical protein